jgi:hypothetical protein
MTCHPLIDEVIGLACLPNDEVDVILEDLEIFFGSTSGISNDTAFQMFLKADRILAK